MKCSICLEQIQIPDGQLWEQNTHRRFTKFIDVVCKATLYLPDWHHRPILQKTKENLLSTNCSQRSSTGPKEREEDSNLFALAPLITSPWPILNDSGWSRSLDESKTLPSVRHPETYRQTNEWKLMLGKTTPRQDGFSTACPREFDKFFCTSDCNSFKRNLCGWTPFFCLSFSGVNGSLKLY